MKMNHSRVIALDGPSGSGKSTIAKEVAKKLSIVYIDTGAMFRAIGLSAHNAGISFEEGEALTTFIKNLDLKYGVSNEILIVANGEDLTSKIRDHHVSELASTISKLPTVRTFLLDFQRSLGNEKTCVMEGRDIGTVVFPNSFCKIFMTASNEVRAERRLKQLREQGDNEIQLDQIIEDIQTRDERDSNRDVAPLKQASDAILLDTSSLTFDQVLDSICDTAHSRGKELGIQV
jgi:cytidylate kinase